MYTRCVQKGSRAGLECPRSQSPDGNSCRLLGLIGLGASNASRLFVLLPPSQLDHACLCIPWGLATICLFAILERELCVRNHTWLASGGLRFLDLESTIHLHFEVPLSLWEIDRSLSTTTPLPEIGLLTIYYAKSLSPHTTN
jgi:hypothetical protein